MAKKRVQRKLAAIISADVVGYSRQVREDEQGTIAAVKDAITGTFAPKIKSHGGRIFKTMGDAVLAEFPSVVDALQCAVAVQKALSTNKLLFRIGINVGDVIVESNDIQGDGVNVAARLEGLAEPGGICISAKVLEEVKDKTDLGFEDLGAQTVKNIDEPVIAYKVLLDPIYAGKLIPSKRATTLPKRWVAGLAAALLVLVAAGLALWQPWAPDTKPASVKRLAFPLPKKPSIAVLPFDNLTGQAGQEIMIDGLVENIITTLSAIPSLFVVARNSTFTYKGRTVKVSLVAEELGVRYVLIGSVQSSGVNARITAQLIDTVSGNQVWAKHYDRELKNIFAVHDEIAWHIATALEVKLVAGEKAREQRATTDDPEAYALLRQGRKLFIENWTVNALKARRLYEQALKRDPKFAAAMVEIARTYLALARDMSEQDRAEAIVKAEKYLNRARAINKPYAGIYEVSGQLLNVKGNYLQARRMLEKAVEMEPSNSEYLRRLAKSFGDRGHPEKAISLMEEAMRLHPYFGRTYTRYLSVAYRRAGRRKKALEIALRLLDYRPVYVSAHRELAVTYAMLGDKDKAREHAKNLLRLKPDFTVQRWGRSIAHVIPEYRKADLDALRAAGVPEGG
jgi:adenylate cyclase